MGVFTNVFLEEGEHAVENVEVAVKIEEVAAENVEVEVEK